MAPMYRGKETLNGKTVIITGCNTGIGKETARDMARRGARVIMACRSLDKAETAKREIVAETLNQNVVVKKLDLSSFASIRAFCHDVNTTEDRLDILINNAAVGATPYAKTVDGLEMQMGTNHFGHFLMTNLLLDKLKASAPSRLVIVSSEAHRMNATIDFDDVVYNEKEGSYGMYKKYSQTKLANLLMMLELKKRLAGTGVTVYGLHPGVVETELNRNNFLDSCCGRCITWPIRICFEKNSSQGAQTTIYCALAPELANESGKYYDNLRERRADPRALNEEDAKRLWDISEEVTGLRG